MSGITRETLLRHPDSMLELVKTCDSRGTLSYRFVATSGNHKLPDETGVELLKGTGADIPRRDIHYALYLFQQLQIQPARKIAAS